MAESYLKSIHTRKIIAENVIFQNLPMSKYVQSKKSMSENGFCKKEFIHPKEHV